MQGANVPDDLVAEAMEIVGSTKDAVLGPLFNRIGDSLALDPQVRGYANYNSSSSLLSCCTYTSPHTRRRDKRETSILPYVRTWRNGTIWTVQRVAGACAESCGCCGRRLCGASPSRPQDQLLLQGYGQI